MLVAPASSVALLLVAVTSGTPADGPAYTEWARFAASLPHAMHVYRYAGLPHGEPVFRETEDGPARTAAEWLDAAQGARPGVAFFTTADGRDPQPREGARRRGRLTPPVTLACRNRPLLVRGFAYFNATRVTCRCARRNAVGPVAGRRGSEAPRPAAHAVGALYNEGDLVLAGGFTLVGEARAGGALRVGRHARLLPLPAEMTRGQFPPPAWRLDVPVPTGWPLARPDALRTDAPLSDAGGAATATARRSAPRR